MLLECLFSHRSVCKDLDLKRNISCGSQNLPIFFAVFNVFLLMITSPVEITSVRLIESIKETRTETNSDDKNSIKLADKSLWIILKHHRHHHPFQIFNPFVCGEKNKKRWIRETRKNGFKGFFFCKTNQVILSYGLGQ
ncbi:AMP deaminase 2 [Sarcoptes scabiei]|nr:AMP deaminase 2 [Sarcoptes scabiei]